MAFGDRFKDWVSSWGDDDTVYEDESSFDEDIWNPPTGTVNPWEVEEDPYGIGSLFDPAPNIFDDEDWATTYDFGDWGAPAEDFEDPSFDYSSFDVDAYLDSLLDPDYGESYTEGDPSDWFINTGDPATQNYERVGGGGSPPPTDPTLLKIAGLLGPNALGPTIVPEEETGIFGGTWGPRLRDAFLGPGGLRGREEGEGIGGIGGGILDLLGSLFGGANKAVGGIGSGLAGLFNSPLGQLAMLNYMKNKNKDIMDIPVGYGDGGGGGGDGSPIDYRVFNLQPALMPGVAYANVAPPVPPPEMRGGGLGDVTLAKLEPGEFVMTKKATDNIGAQNLYRMMKQAEGRG